MTIPLHARQTFWRIATALESIRDAQRTCDLIIFGEVKQPSPLYRALVTAVHVMYAKPFLKSYGTPHQHSIPESIVPERLRALHDTLVAHRKLIVAHSEANADYCDLSDTFLLQVEFCNTKHLLGWSVSTVVPEPFKFDEVAVLCQEVGDALQKAMNHFSEKYVDALPTEPGVHLLQIESEGQAPFRTIAS